MNPPPTVRLFDNVLPEENQKRILQYLEGSAWTYGAYSDETQGASRYFFKHFAGYFRDGEHRQDAAIDAELQAFPIIASFWHALSQSFLKGHTLMRCYANAYPAGTEGGLHKDSLEPNHFTAIYYPHLAWHPNYAGETVFFNDEGNEIVASVYPKPNRLALFSGSIPHAARGISRTCPNMRITLMFKTAVLP